MHDGLPEDVASALARLEAGEPGPQATVPGRWEPRTTREAVEAWMKSLGARHGAYLTPPMTKMELLFQAHARSQGWALDGMSPHAMGRMMKSLGFDLASRNGVRGALVAKDVARALWGGKTGWAKSRKKPRRITAPLRKKAPLFWEALVDRRGGDTPLVDTMGRVWPSASCAALLLSRVSACDIHASAQGKGRGTGGCLWRYLTPDEAATVPLLHVSGQVLGTLAWGSSPAARNAMRVTLCVTCGGATDGAGHGGGGVDSPGPPAHGTHAGGPTHTPAQNPSLPSQPVSEAQKTNILASITRAHTRPSRHPAKESPSTVPYGTVSEPLGGGDAEGA